ncbi:hypothetical protein GWO68_12800 [Pontibacter sp. BT213]|uniref:SH3 domain-containing protein n=1 Tax=Pontibacter fetidus TaxID=2700082 RepID=A0A6B2H0K7_9BACT|nr:hypothetical protein [Pontibacter fetidus]
MACTACQTEIEKQDTSEATIASETGMPPVLPADVLYVTKPLIKGELYSKPDFDSPTLAHFDTSQQIQLLDTTGTLFLKARIDKNAESITGYISKAIVPEQR